MDVFKNISLVAVKIDLNSIPHLAKSRSDSACRVIQGLWKRKLSPTLQAAPSP